LVNLFELLRSFETWLLQRFVYGGCLPLLRIALLTEESSELFQ
jgi:hypothetical protein